MRNILENGFKELGIKADEKVYEQFQSYYDYLTEQNAVMNLTAIKGVEDSARLHFLDCCAVTALYDFKNADVVDIGTGAGFPALPIKIIEPTAKVTMVDGTQKRINFLERCCSLLELSKVECVCGRAEDLAPDIGGSFDIAVSRAVARLNILCELCLPFVHVGGAFIAMKGPDVEEELNEAQNAIRILGGGNVEVKTYTIPETDISHSAIIIKKIKPSPAIYPRVYGRIKKLPL